MQPSQTATTFDLPPQKSAGFGRFLWENDKTLRRYKKWKFQQKLPFFFASAIPSYLLESSSLFLTARDVFNFHPKYIYVLPKYFVLLLLLLEKKITRLKAFSTGRIFY